MLSLKIAIASTLLGLSTLSGIAYWYWKNVFPELYVDQSFVPFILMIVIASLLYSFIFLGAWLKFTSKRHGTFISIVSIIFVIAISFGTITTYGVTLLPSALLASFGLALAPRA